jgi:predicted DNA-binding helix-hairpin-helix protein
MSDAPGILVVDTSYIAVGFFLCQCSQADVRKCIYNRFRSITLNKWEVHFSQLKLEIYRLYRALRVLRMYTRKFVKTDVRCIKRMLVNPDIQPSASIN